MQITSYGTTKLMQVKKVFICFILAQLRHLTLSLVARTSLIAINTF